MYHHLLAIYAILTCFFVLLDPQSAEYLSQEDTAKK